MSVAYEVVDSFSGSVTLEEGESAVTEVRRRYIVGRFASFNAVRSFVEPYLPLYCIGAGSLAYWVRQALNIQGVGNGYYDITAVYRTKGFANDQGGEQNGEQQDPDNFVAGSIAWDTSGHTEHITQAKSQVKFPGDAGDFHGAINVSGDSVLGVDVVRPQMRYSETWIFPTAKALECSYVGKVYELTGTVNQANFRCFKPGECLFLGARGQWSDNAPYVAITYEFEARPNITWGEDNQPFEGAGATGEKQGWEHLWIRYESGEDADSIIKKPIAAYQSKVYDSKDWGDLLIVQKQVGRSRTGVQPQPGAVLVNGLTDMPVPSGVPA